MRPPPLPTCLPRALFATGAFLAAAANLGFAFVASDVATALPFRFVTGLALAGVYPIGLKLLAGWFRSERGLAIGVLVGALTVGSALPYLLRAIGASQGVDWRATVGSGQRRCRPRRAAGPRGRSRGRGTRRRRGSASMSPGRRSASPRSGSRTSATSATCGSSTRCGPGCRCSSPRASPRPGSWIPRRPARPRSRSSASGGVGCVARGPARGPPRANHADDRGDGCLGHERRRRGVRLRRLAGGHRRGRDRLGRHGRRRIRRSSRRRSRSSRRPGRRAPPWRCRWPWGSC